MGLDTIDPEAGTDTAALAAIADHWWVQADIDGAFVDLDPLFGASDEARPAAASTLDPEALPDDLRHALTVRVVAETWAEDGLSVFTPLEYTHRFGVGLPHRTAELRFDYWADAEPDAEITSLEALTDAVSHWQPVLTIDGQQVRGEWFSNAGQLEEPTSLAIGEAGEAATSALGGLGDAEPAEAPATELSGVWIEYEADGPGVSPHVERRELSDLLGAERRSSDDAGKPKVSALEARARSAALLGTTSMLLQEAALHPDALVSVAATELRGQPQCLHRPRLHRGGPRRRAHHPGDAPNDPGTTQPDEHGHGASAVATRSRRGLPRPSQRLVSAPGVRLGRR